MEQKIVSLQKTGLDVKAADVKHKTKSFRGPYIPGRR